eukprot:249169_1
MWQCQHCDLRNYPQQTLCTACFNPRLTISQPLNHYPIQPPPPTTNSPLSISINVSPFLVSLEAFDVSELDQIVIPMAEQRPNHQKTQSKSIKIDVETIKPIIIKQRLLYDGYIRTQVVQIVIDYIPNDILHLIFKFFNIDIELLCLEIQDAKLVPHCSRYDHQILNMRSLYKSASILRKQRQYFVANEILMILIAFNSEKAKYFNERGLILKLWGELREAEVCYRRAIELKPSSSTQRWNFGLLLEEQEHYAYALEQFMKAKELDRGNKKQSEYIFEIAYCHQKLNNFDCATEHYLKAIAMDATKPKYYIYYADYLCSDLKDFSQSKKYFEKLIELEPNNANCYYQYARIWRDYGRDYEKAEFYYKKCLQIDDRTRGLNGSYGYLLYLMRRYDEAKKYLKTAITYDRKTVWSHYYYALLQKEIGHDSEADESLVNAVNITTKISSILGHLQTIKEADPKQIHYHNRFEELLKDKLGKMLTGNTGIV